MIAWIVCRDGRLPFVAGVFASRTRAEAELAAIPSDIRARCAVEERADLEFPCFILEADGGFELATEAEALAAVVAIRPESRVSPGAGADEDELLMNVYRLTDEFAPPRPGVDDMGHIPHRHLDAPEVETIRRLGLAALWTIPAAAA